MLFFLCRFWRPVPEAGLGASVEIETGWTAFGVFGPRPLGAVGFSRIAVDCFAIVRPPPLWVALRAPPVEGYTMGVDFPGSGLVMLLSLLMKWVVTGVGWSSCAGPFAGKGRGPESPGPRYGCGPLAVDQRRLTPAARSLVGGGLRWWWKGRGPPKPGSSLRVSCL